MVPRSRLICRGEFIHPVPPAGPFANRSALWPVAADRAIAFCRSELARERLLAQKFEYGAALSSARPTGCALHGASLFLVWPRKSNQKEGHPCIRVLLRKTSLPPAPLRRSSRRDIHVPSLLARHPCLATPYATPALGLLKGTWNRVVWRFSKSISNKKLCPFPFARPTRQHQTPLSGGRMESLRRGASGMDAARAVKGHGWPLRGDPRSSDGVRGVERSEPRMQGQAFLLTFFGAGHPATEKSESPSRAKPMPRPTPPIGFPARTQTQELREQARSYNSPRRTVRADRLQAPTRHQKRPLVCA